ncbi:MAG: butyrate kinase [Smithellaceae bacterium]
MNILAFNISSTSTDVAFFSDGEEVSRETIEYKSEALAQYVDFYDQLSMREKDIAVFIKRQNLKMKNIDMIVSRGGVGKPVPAGVYRINMAMCEDVLSERYGEHPANLGPPIAYKMARKIGAKAIVIDPPTTDEFHSLARVTGIPELERRSGFHALNQKAAARRAAADIGKKYEAVNLIVAHLGGGISIGAHKRGSVIDATHGLNEGPLTPERAGSLPTLPLLELAFSGQYDLRQLQRKLSGQAGLSAYLGTTDAKEVEKMIQEGDGKAKLVYNAMIYQIAKNIGAMAAVLKGKIDGIVITGDLAYSDTITNGIKEYVEFLSPVFIYPGEDEMRALGEGALRVLKGEEEIKDY